MLVLRIQKHFNWVLTNTFPRYAKLPQPKWQGLSEVILVTDILLGHFHVLIKQFDQNFSKIEDLVVLSLVLDSINSL